MSATKPDEDLPQLKAELKQHCDRWLARTLATHVTNKRPAEAAVAGVYDELLWRKPPPVIWCESPWQLAALKSIMALGLSNVEIEALCTQARTSRLFPSGNTEALLRRAMRVLNERVPSELRDNLRTKPNQREIANPPQPPPWLGTLNQLNPFIRHSHQPAPTQTIGLEFAAKQNNLTNELFGVCSYLDESSGYAELRQLYDESFIRVRQESPANIVRMDISTSATTLIAFESMPDFNGQFALDLALAAVRGEAVDEYERLVNRIEFRPFHFAMHLIQSNLDAQWPAWSLNWLPFFEYMLQKFPNIAVGPANKRRLKAALELAEHCSCFALCDSVAFLCVHPTELHLDETGRLHSEEGPSLSFTDGYEIYGWHGTRVPPEVIYYPGKITVPGIEREFNAEVRRVMIDRYGIEKYIMDCGAVKIHEDECGILYRKELVGDEPLVMVRVLNSTPEPDGSTRSYFLRVPPNIRTARAAVAWTFDVPEREYKPKKQT